MRTIYLIGDSTVDDNQPPFRGWGWALPRFVREDVTVKNHALSGRSSKSFWDEKLFEPVEAEMGAGDLLLIQFGHNDENKEKPERYTEPEEEYPRNLKIFVDRTREKGAVPVLMTPICIRNWQGGVHEPSHGVYPRKVLETAEKLGVPCVDLYADSLKIVEEAGEEKSEKLFMNLEPGEDPRQPEGRRDNAHTREAGARAFAEAAARRLREMKLA